MKEQLKDTANGHKVTGRFSAQGLRTSWHSQRQRPDSGSQVPSRTPTLILLSPSISGLGAGSGGWANLIIPSAQTLSGPYSEPRGAEMKCLGWYPLPALTTLRSLGSQISQPSSGLKPGPASLYSSPGLPEAGWLSSPGSHSTQHAQSCQLACGCVGFSAQLAWVLGISSLHPESGFRVISKENLT